MPMSRLDQCVDEIRNGRLRTAEQRRRRAESGDIESDDAPCPGQVRRDRVQTWCDMPMPWTRTSGRPTRCRHGATPVHSPRLRSVGDSYLGLNASQDTSGFQFTNVPFGLSFHAHTCSV